MTNGPDPPDATSPPNTTSQKPKSRITSSFTTFFTKLLLRKGNEKHGRAKPPTTALSNANTEALNQSHKDKKWQRAQRRSHRESEDYLGVVGANPDTGLFDVLSPVESSETGSSKTKEGSGSGSGEGYREGKILRGMIKGRRKEGSEWIGDILLQEPLRIGLGGGRYWGLMSDEAKKRFGKDFERMRSGGGQGRVVDKENAAERVGAQKLSGEMGVDERWKNEQDGLQSKHHDDRAVVERLKPRRQPDNFAREEDRTVHDATTNIKDNDHASEMTEIKRTPRNLRDLESTGTVIRTPQKTSILEEKPHKDSTPTPPKKPLPSMAIEMPIILETNPEPKPEIPVPARETSPAVHIHHHHHYHHYWVVDSDGRRGNWGKKSSKMDDVPAPAYMESQFDTKFPEEEVVKKVVRDDVGGDIDAVGDKRPKKSGSGGLKGSGPKDSLDYSAHEKKGTFGDIHGAAVNVSAVGGGIGVPIVGRGRRNSRTRRHRRSFR